MGFFISTSGFTTVAATTITVRYKAARMGFKSIQVILLPVRLLVNGYDGDLLMKVVTQ